MIAAYLGFNAVLYFVFAAWCTWRADATAKALGYEALSRGGQSEYLVIYGGLQLGLAAAFALFAWQPAYRVPGLAFALCLYTGIVLYRAVTLWCFGPVPALTWGVGALELTLLVGAAVLWITR
jgi:hypothetical protein